MSDQTVDDDDEPCFDDLWAAFYELEAEFGHLCQTYLKLADSHFVPGSVMSHLENRLIKWSGKERYPKD
jgi:hypothetical protein